MKTVLNLRSILGVIGAGLALASAVPARAGEDVDVQKLLKANGCAACHAKDKKIVGPAFHDVAAKYAGDAEAAAKVAANIRSGGVGRWGQIPMPPMKSLTDADLAALADFVLKQ